MDWKQVVELSVEQQEAAVGKQVGRSIPAHVVERVELGGNARNGGRNDSGVESLAKDGETQAKEGIRNV